MDTLFMPLTEKRINGFVANAKGQKTLTQQKIIEAL